ncbi:RNA ligase partner protein [Pyrofollis japonicus]|uniref:RNA ligase partner protein n=1 Tax=Pyrofollis japonicus TaxID=3060460 RepID=UPI00295BC160|nr:RNA ligase partner protein [Pyrofollis japonicus]BEP17458.1 RNA ligase partner protein [Pyrofollis japonicus]
MAEERRLQRSLRVYVLDTSALTDPRIRGLLGAKDVDEAIRLLAEMLAEARLVYGLEIYMPPSVYEEARRFLLSNGVSLKAFEELSTWITIKPPARHEIRVPATVFREYVEEVRNRMTRGLRVAEEHVRRAFEAGGMYPQESTPRDTRSEKLGALIRGLRERYRQATRHGVLDSVEDLDAILLALELQAILVSNDEGVRRFAEALGVVSIDPLRFIGIVRRLTQRAKESEKGKEEAKTLQEIELVRQES